MTKKWVDWEKEEITENMEKTRYARVRHQQPTSEEFLLAVERSLGIDPAKAEKLDKEWNEGIPFRALKDAQATKIDDIVAKSDTSGIAKKEWKSGMSFNDMLTEEQKKERKNSI